MVFDSLLKDEENYDCCSSFVDVEGGAMRRRE